MQPLPERDRLVVAAPHPADLHRGGAPVLARHGLVLAAVPALVGGLGGVGGPPEVPKKVRVAFVSPANSLSLHSSVRRKGALTAGYTIVKFDGDPL